MKTLTLMLAALVSGAVLAPAGNPKTNNPAARATNQLGLDLYRLLAGREKNLCLSPYSIQTAFAMTTNGAAGRTLDEMLKVLHYESGLDPVNEAFAALASDFAMRQQRAADRAKRTKQDQPSFELLVANRLFGQEGYPFEKPFLNLLETKYRAPLQLADFKNAFARERETINEWVEKQTRERIEDLLPEGSLNDMTRLVLVNAIYLKAAWVHQFKKSSTAPAAFHVAPDRSVETPTMRNTARFGYAKEDGFTAVTLPYAGNFAMLVLVPDAVDGLAAVEPALRADRLASLAVLPTRKVDLHFPKFKIEAGTVPLKDAFQKLGMKLAFNRKHADFGRMTADKTLPGLYIDNAYHKTFIEVDEKGTEAAAATAVVMAQKTAIPRPENPVVVRVDRPFFYAIMDTTSRTALFMGRVTDPR